MLTVSERFRRRLAETRTLAARATVLVDGVAVATATVVDGEFTADRTKPIRYGCSLVLAPDTPLSRDALSPYRARLLLERGLVFTAGDAEFVPCGLYRVEHVDTGLPRDRVSVDGLGLEAYLLDDPHEVPDYFPGGSALAELTRLIDGSLPGRTYVTAHVPDRDAAGVSWEKDRWGGEDASAQQLARALGAEVFADASGRFQVRPTPGIEDTAAGEFAAGVNLVRADVGYSREGVANVVVAKASRMDGGTPPAPGVAWDADPYSPTFLHASDPWAKPVGGFGRAVRPYATGVIDTHDGLVLAARSVLADSRGLVSTASVTALADPTLQPGDVRWMDGPLGREKRIVDAFTCPIGPGDMRVTMRTTRIAL